MNIHSWGKNIRIAFYTTTNITILITLFQMVNELDVHCSETIHRLTVYWAMHPSIFSLEGDRLIASILMIFITIFQLYSSRSKVGKLKYIPPILTFTSMLTLNLSGFSKFSLPLILTSIILYLKLNSKIIEYINFTVTFLLIIELTSLIRWVTYPFLKTEFYFDASWIAPKIDRYLFNLMNLISPYLVTILIFSSWIRSFIFGAIIHVREWKVEEGGVKIIFERGVKSEDISKVNLEFKSRVGSLILNSKFAFTFSTLSIIYLSYYPYTPSINPSQIPVSVDIMYHYVPNLKAFEKLGLTLQGIISLFKGLGFRPFIVLSLFFMKNITGLSYVDVVKLAILIANILFAFSIYYSLLITTRNRNLSTISLYLSTFSIHVVVNMYAGYLAMLTSISFITLSSAFLAKAVDRGKLRYLIPATLFSLLALLSHPWSWLIFAAATTALLPLTITLKYFKTIDCNRRGFLAIAIFILTHLTSIVTFMLIPSSKSPIDLVLMTYYGWTNGGIHNIPLYGPNLRFSLDIYVGGFLNNWLIYVLSIIGATSILKYRNSFLNIILIILPVVLPVFLLCNYNAQHRILFFLQTEIFSTIGLLQIFKWLERKVDSTKLFLLILLTLANYSFRSIANLI